MNFIECFLASMVCLLLLVIVGLVGWHYVKEVDKVTNAYAVEATVLHRTFDGKVRVELAYDGKRLTCPIRTHKGSPYEGSIVVGQPIKAWVYRGRLTHIDQCRGLAASEA